MQYDQAVSQTWRHSTPPLTEFQGRELVRYATLAASSHNTQPWRFNLGPDSIEIWPDFSRRCPAVDPDDHHLFASLGCALENLLLAADHAGAKGIVRFDDVTKHVRINFEKAAPVRSLLFDAVLSRQCTRTAYDGKSLSSTQLKLLQHAGRGEGVSVLLLTSAQQKEAVAEYVAQGNSIQFDDAAWAAELQHWIRFNARDAIRTGDGLYGPVMGNPSVPTWLGKIFMRAAFSSKAQNRKDTRNILSSGAIAVIYSDTNDPRHWVEAGRCYERLALQAAALDLRTAFINQPVEVEHLRSQFAQYLGLGNRRPDLVVRIGHGPLAPKSLRRPVDEVIMDSAIRNPAISDAVQHTMPEATPAAARVSHASA